MGLRGTCKLLIWFKTDDSVIIPDVSNYGVVENTNGKILHYVRNGVRSFIPSDVVLYFGEQSNFEIGDE